MQIETLIEEKNLKLTSARRELLEIFFKENRPLSFDDIKNKLTMDKATFYRNVSKFESVDLVSSFESNDKKRYYELQKTPHAHFICNTCNSIECIEAKELNLKGYKVMDIIYKGICKRCLKA